MSDGESQLGIDTDTDPEAEARAAAAHGEDHHSMLLVTANRDAPEGIAPAERAGTGRASPY